MELVDIVIVPEEASNAALRKDFLSVEVANLDSLIQKVGSLLWEASSVSFCFPNSWLVFAV